MNQATTYIEKGKNRWKIENFTLYLEGSESWKVSGRDLDGHYRRIRFQAKNKTEAIQTARDILRIPVQPAQAPFPLVRISDALMQAAKCRNWNEAHRENDIRNCEYFLRWVDQLGLCYWHELRFQHVERYQQELVYRRLAFDTVRLYLWPVRRTAKWMASNWPDHYHDICEHVRISRRGSGRELYHDDLGTPVLSIAELLDLLLFVYQHPIHQKLTASMALQGLMGLRMQESLRLTWSKIQWDRGTLVVDGQVKNEFSVRSLPVPALVQWLLQQKYRMDPQPESQDLITPYFSSFREYSSRVRALLKQWNPEIRLKPKDLRNTVPTAAIDGGWHSIYVERYLGHTPNTITGRHYHGDQRKRMIALFREQVVKHIDAAVEQWKSEQMESKFLPCNSVSEEMKGC